MQNDQAHWDKVYLTRQPNELSWTQKNPAISLEFIRHLNLPKSSGIIDIGGGDSPLVDYLINDGFEDITVLDISEYALDRAKRRMGIKAKSVHWELTDITEFKPARHYDFWHDRATFHFLNQPEQISKYLDIAGRCVDQYLIIGTFSEQGPDKCSGLPVMKYSVDLLEKQFSKNFVKLNCISEDHRTPFDTKQNFLFCSFKRNLSCFQ